MIAFLTFSVLEMDNGSVSIDLLLVRYKFGGAVNVFSRVVIFTETFGRVQE
jgi:hypothetical protein